MLVGRNPFVMDTSQQSISGGRGGRWQLAAQSCALHFGQTQQMNCVPITFGSEPKRSCGLGLVVILDW